MVFVVVLLMLFRVIISVLGLMWFSLYTRDLSEGLDHVLVGYADDFKLKLKLFIVEIIHNIYNGKHKHIVPITYYIH